VSNVIGKEQVSQRSVVVVASTSDVPFIFSFNEKLKHLTLHGCGWLLGKDRFLSWPKKLKAAGYPAAIRWILKCAYYSYICTSEGRRA
tara:strand:+ start:509 stop:772 length:264 start_codon:yes stop_codon:yes gene_type:complete